MGHYMPNIFSIYIYIYIYIYRYVMIKATVDQVLSGQSSLSLSIINDRFGCGNKVCQGHYSSGRSLIRA